MTLAERENKAIETLKKFEPQDGSGYYLCYSGGKDSDVIRILAGLACVKHDIVHNLTTVDAPETIQYIKSIPGVVIERPKLSMWQLIVKKGMPPLRHMRYCCSELKERGGSGRVKITGVRRAESASRAESAGLVKIIGRPISTQKIASDIGADWRVNRMGSLVLNDDNDESRAVVEYCYRTTSTMVNPIVDWTNDDVWNFLRYYGCAANPRYQCGEHRIGCIGCPLSGYKGMKKDFAKYPIYRSNYVKAFDRMLDARLAKGLTHETWKTGEDVMRWWVGDDPRQITLDDIEEAVGIDEISKWY